MGLVGTKDPALGGALTIITQINRQSANDPDVSGSLCSDRETCFASMKEKELAHRAMRLGVSGRNETWAAARRSQLLHFGRNGGKRETEWNWTSQEKN